MEYNPIIVHNPTIVHSNYYINFDPHNIIVQNNLHFLLFLVNMIILDKYLFQFLIQYINFLSNCFLILRTNFAIPEHNLLLSYYNFIDIIINVISIVISNTIVIHNNVKVHHFIDHYIKMDLIFFYYLLNSFSFIHLNFLRYFMIQFPHNIPIIMVININVL